MARRPTSEPRPRRRAARPAAPPTGEGLSGTPRERIIAAFLDLLADTSFEEIGLRDVAEQAGVSLADLREEFASTFAIYAAHVKAIDRQVLSRSESSVEDIEEESPRERLFDVLMNRLDALAPYRTAVLSLMRSAGRNAPLALALNGLAVRSQQWMLTAAGIEAAGPRGLMRAQGLAVMFARVLRVWVRDEDPGLARTMASLDRGLSRGERMVGLLDGLSCLLQPRIPSFRRRRRDDYDDDRDYGRRYPPEGPDEAPAAL